MTSVRVQINSMFLCIFWPLVSNSALFCFAIKVLSKPVNNNTINIKALPPSNGAVFFLSSSALLDLGSARWENELLPLVDICPQNVCSYSVLLCTSRNNEHAAYMCVCLNRILKALIVMYYYYNWHWHDLTFCLKQVLSAEWKTKKTKCHALLDTETWVMSFFVQL